MTNLLVLGTQMWAIPLPMQDISCGHASKQNVNRGLKKTLASFSCPRPLVRHLVTQASTASCTQKAAGFHKDARQRFNPNPSYPILSSQSIPKWHLEAGSRRPRLSSSVGPRPGWNPGNNWQQPVPMLDAQVTTSNNPASF